MTTTSSFISKSATLELSFLPASFVLIADSRLAGMRPTSFSSVARLLLSRARHRRHPDLLFLRIRRPVIREILANAPAVGSKPVDNWRVRRERHHHIHRIVAERASIEAGNLKYG